MNKIWILAKNSLREFIRDRIVVVCLFISVLLMAVSFLLGALSFSEQQRILAHLGLTAIHLAGLGIACFFGSFVIAREVEKQTCLLVLARPLTRSQFFLGKLLGVQTLMTLVFGLLALVLFVLLQMNFSFVNYVEVLWGMYLEITVLISLAFFFSQIMRPSVALFFSTLGLFLIGNWMEELTFFARKMKSDELHLLSEFVEWFLPNLYRFNWRSVVYLEKGVSNANLLWVSLHAFGWILLLTAASNFFFRRKDLV